MRYLKKGTRQKAFIWVIVATCFYTIWTTYRTNLFNVQTSNTRSCKDRPEICLLKSLSNDISLTTTTTIPHSILNSTQYTVKVTTFPNNVLNSTQHTEKVTNLHSQTQNISVKFNEKWVGFPEIASSNCTLAFSKVVNNSLFPQKVGRVFPDQFLADSNNCGTFIKKYGFNRYPGASKEELEFPIAFIILFNKDLDQVLFLLRALYRSHNVYCLSVDIKVSIEFLEAVKSVIKCLPNVFLASKLENIVYAGFSRLMADIDCMDDLLKHPVQWKYTINMPGQQFPLRTNLELVRILKMYNGSNDVEGILGNRRLLHRFQPKYIYIRNNDTGEMIINKNGATNAPPPYGLGIVKGSAYGTFSRAFVNFVLHDKVAKDFLEYSKSIYSPDEYFWATLHHSKSVHVPGGYTAGEPDKKPWLSSFASWGGQHPCATIRVRGVCIFSPSDLPYLMTRHEHFANKFYITHHPAALHCLDQLLYNLTISGTTRNLTFYQNLPFASKIN